MRPFGSDWRALVASLPLVLALALGGCSVLGSIPGYVPPPEAPPARPEPEFAHLDTRADSLLALPPDSLTAAQMEWLRFYEQRRAQRSADRRQEEVMAEVRRTNKTLTQLMAASVFLAVISYFVYHQSAN